jgi:hypothetical protein
MDINDRSLDNESDLSFSHSWVNADPLAAAAFTLKGYNPINEGKQRVITAAAHINTRMHLGASLADQNVASPNDLPTEALNAESLSIRVPTVPSTTCSFLMSHSSLSTPCTYSQQR